MANIWENSVITNKGMELQAKILAGSNIAITSVKVGAGRVSVDQLKNQVAVSQIKTTASIMDMYTEDYTAIISVQLKNDDITEAFDLNQVGFYALDPEEGEILYALAQTTNARHVPTEAEMPNYILNWNFHFSLSNEFNLVVNSNPAGLVPQAQFDALKEKHEALDTEYKEFKDLVENQIVSIENAITTGSTFVEIVSQVFKYNKLTGAVHGEVIYDTLKNMVDNEAYNLGNILIKYAPINRVPITFSMLSEDKWISGRIQERTNESSPGRIIIRTHTAINSGNTIYASYDYYIEPGIE